MVGEVDCGVTVAKWYTCEVPEDEHEAPFLVVHVPEVVRIELPVGFRQLTKW